MADYAPTVRKILSENGCRLERQGKGDHEIWYSPLTKLRFPVDGKIKSRHTANGILKQAGLPKQF
jgi:predicted RNA binding protein YcfA (HicA-like mRNA interferase family)